MTAWEPSGRRYADSYSQEPPPPPRRPPPRRVTTPATSALIIVIVIGFIIEIVTGAWLSSYKLALLGSNLSMPLIVDSGQYWRWLTSMFLHGDGTIRGDLLHLLSNLWALYQLGTLFEVMFGTRRFVLTYFATGIIASITSSFHLAANGSSVGASGAIFGILGAFIFSVRRSPVWRNDPRARHLMPQLLFWIAVNIIIGFSIAQIDNAAHIGGLVAGLLLGFLPHRIPPPPPGASVIEVTPRSPI